MRICIFSPVMTQHRKHYLPVPARLARDFTAMGHDVIALATVAPNEEPGEVVEGGSKVYYLERTDPGRANDRYWRLSAQKFDFLHSEAPFDFVIGRGNAPYGFFLYSSFSAQVPVICHEGTYPEWPHKLERISKLLARFLSRPVMAWTSLSRPIYRKCLVKADRVVCNSPALAEVLAKMSLFSPPKTAFIPYGFDLGPYNAALAKNGKCMPPRILFVGRLAWDKGVVDMIEILAKVKRRDVVLEVIGPGSDKVKNAMLKRAFQLGVETRVLFAGPVHNTKLPERLVGAQAFLLPSTHAEGLNKTIMEAMSARLPVVTYEIPGMDVLVQEGKTGWMVPIRNIAAAAAKIDALLADAGAAERMGAAGQERIADVFSHAKVANAWNALFEDVLIDRVRSKKGISRRQWLMRSLGRRLS